MSTTRYEQYKDSGVEWLGRVPTHWDVLSLKAVATCNDEVLSEATDPETVIEYVEISGVEECLGITHTETLSFGSAPSRARRLVRPGDVLISTVRTYLRGIATVVDPPDNLIASTGFAAIRPRKVSPGYLGYLLHCEYLLAEVISRSVGVSYPAINASDLMCLKGPIPTIPEQHAIAAFLDCEIAKIDVLVEEQKRLIELLKEKRQAVISQAVTKGLNPNVPMKTSEVMWLGNVPAHWEILKASHIGTLFGSDQIDDAMVTDEGSLPFIKVASLDSDGFSIRSWDWFVDPSIEHLYKPRTDFIVFPKRGAAIFLNKVNVVDRCALIDPNLMGWEMNGRTIARFIAFCLKARRLDELADVSTVPQINNKHIYPEKFPVPPLEEQAAIVDFIVDALARIDELMTEAARATHLLHERRSALISAAVTGKIDVRSWRKQEELEPA